MNYKRILLSVSMIAFAGALVAGATGAFFSDTETSTGNTFTAGAIDLQVANTSYVTNANGELEQSSTTTFDELGEDGELFFDFADLKPGDIGEDTITLNVDSNDAWACMANNITATPENGQTEPEAEVDETDGENEGELQEELMFAVWADDGDNVYENDERLLKLGDETPFVTAEELASEDVQTLADSEYSVFAEENAGEPLTGGEDYHIGKAWCLGDMSEDPVDQDSETAGNPVERGTGFTCDGSVVDNSTQTDGIESALEFYAVQSRNNDDFTCSEADLGGGGDEGDDERDITGTPRGTWSKATNNKDWVAKGRYGGDNTYELEVGTQSTGDRSEDEHSWPNNEEESFELSYDGAATATLTVGGDSSSYNVPAPDANSFLAIVAKTADQNDDGTRVDITDVKLDGVTPAPVSTFASSTANSVSAETDSAGRGINSLDIEGDIGLTDGFTLTGKVKFDYGSNPQDEGPAFEIVVGQES